MKDTKPPSRTADQFVVRLPDGMRDQIAEAAKANNRSMNAEIVARLQESLNGFTKKSASEMTVKINEKAWAAMLAKLDDLDSEVKALPFRLRPLPEGTLVLNDKLALIKHLGQEPSDAKKKRAIRKKKEDDQES